MQMSQYDYKMYKDELDGLQERMTDLLLKMEEIHMLKTEEEFYQWWEEEGNCRKYFDMKGRAEIVENMLASATIVEEDVPRMRSAGGGRYIDPWGM